MLSCIYLDVYLVISLLGSSMLSSFNMFGLLVIPIALFIVSGSALLANRLILNNRTQKGFKFKQTVVFGAKKKEKKALIQRRVVRPLETAKPKIEFGFHTCPVHGVEKCAGNYLDLHSCNDTTQSSSKQIFWKEITPALPSK